MCGTAPIHSVVNHAPPEAMSFWDGYTESVKRACRVAQRCLLHGPVIDWNKFFPFLMLFSVFTVEVISIQVMGLISSFYYAISSGDIQSFYQCLKVSAVVVMGISVSVTAKKIAIDACALQWREDIVLWMHSEYFSRFFAYDMLRSFGSKAIDNPDQRIQQDADKYALQLAQILSSLLPIPGVIIYYSFSLWKHFGWLVPMACYLFFALSASIVSIFAKKLIPIVCCQDQLEGEFRYRHSRFSANIESVTLMRGESAEMSKINSCFENVCHNMRYMIIKRIPLYFWVTWFSYTGSIVNYLVIGCALLFTNKGDVSESDSAALLAQGSYACLYLISSFSTILDMSSKFTELCGYAERILEVVDYKGARTAIPQCVTFRGTHGQPLGRHSVQPRLRFLQCWQKAMFPRSVGKISLLKELERMVCCLFKRATGDYLVLQEEDTEVELTHNLRDTDCESLCITDSVQVTTSNSHSRPSVLGAQAIALSSSGFDPAEPLVCIKGLTLMSPGSDPKVLIKDLCLNIYSGDKLYITGESGCGKTSLFRALAGCVLPLEREIDEEYTHACRTQKSVRTDNFNQSCDCSIHFNCLEEDVAYVPQDAYYTEGGLIDNILYPGSKDTVADWCDRLGSLRKFSSTFWPQCGDGIEDDFSSVNFSNDGILKFGVTLSPGELQKINILRAIFSGPKIILLDEGTSSMDSNLEQLCFFELLRCCDTIVTIGHRESLFKYHTRHLHLHKDGTYILKNI